MMAAKPRVETTRAGREEIYDEVRTRIMLGQSRQTERERTLRRRLLWIVTLYGASLGGLVYVLFG